MTSLEPLLSITEAYEILGISESSLHRLVKRGELPTVFVGNRRRLIEPQALRDYIAARRLPWNDEGPDGTGPLVTTSADAGDGDDSA